MFTLLYIFYQLFLGGHIAFVQDSRKDNSSRNVFRYKEFDNKILLSKVEDHFICKFSCLKSVI